MDRYRIGELAKRTGVSVRTLHHYDRIGLVQPSARSEAGYRLYTADDAVRLQQVLTLRYFGFRLAEIGTLLDAPGQDVAQALQAQRRVLQRRAADIQAIDGALGQVIALHETQGGWSWDAVTEAIVAVRERLTEGAEDMKDLYTEEQMRQFAELREQVGDDEIHAIEEAWKELVTEIQSKLDLDPASPEAQALAERWTALNERMMAPYRAYPDLMAAIGQNFKDNKFNYEAQPGIPSPTVWEFIGKAQAAKRG